MNKNSEEYRKQEIRKYLEPLFYTSENLSSIVDDVYYLSTRIYIEPTTQEQLERTYQHLKIPHRLAE